MALKSNRRNRERIGSIFRRCRAFIVKSWCKYPVMSSSNITELLKKAEVGDRDSLDRLLPLVYDELRAVARRQLSRERSDHTLHRTRGIYATARTRAGRLE